MSNPVCMAMRSSCLCVAIVAALSSPLPASAANPAPDEAAQQAVTLDAIHVHGVRDRAQAERALTPGSVSVVDGASFHERSVGNVADALRYVPGVWTQSSTGGDAIFISSRGSNLDATDYDSNGVKLFQDGLPITTADGNNHNRFPDPMAASRVIVAHGANALAYGASNLGGAMDFVSATARDGAATQFVLDAGSHGLLGGRLTGGGVADDFDGQVTLEARSRDGYRRHSRQDRSGLYANGGWQVSDDFDLRVFATHIDNDEQLAGALTRAQFDQDPYQANPSAISGNYQLNVRTSRLAAKGNWHIEPGRRLEFGLSYEDQDLYHPIVDKIMVDFDGPGPNPPVEVFSLLKDTRQRTLGGMVRYQVQRGDHDVLAGINLATTHETGANYRNDGGRRNGRTGLIDNRSGSVEAFVLDRWRLRPGWTRVYGVQGVLTGRDVRNTDLASGSVRHPDADYSSLNPRVGVIRTLAPSAEAFASLSRLYEAPTTFELEDDVRGGDATLDAMHGSVLEVGLRGSATTAAATRLHWDVSLYYARIRDEILSVDDPSAPGTSLSANIDRTVHAGIEAVAGASFAFGDGSHRIEPLLSASYNAFSFDGDRTYGDNDLPAAPDYAIRGELLYRNDSGFFAGPTFDLVGARHADFDNRYRVRGYRLLGLRAGIERGRWTLFAEARNLLDKEYVGTFSVRDRAGADDAILQAGAPRSLAVGVRLQF